MEAQQKPPAPKKKLRRRSLYQSVWRWHFYAGLIIMPFLIILAVTGGIYLFKPQIEAALYKDYYEVTPQTTVTTPSEQIDTVETIYPDAAVTSYRPSDSPDRSAEIGIQQDGTAFTVFVDPYTNVVLGKLEESYRLVNVIEKIHGELLMGTVGDRIVEWAACWALILLITGVYLGWPKSKTRIRGVLVPRLNKGKKLLARDMHVVPAFWISLGLLFLILTGLPWSGLWGNNFQALTTNAGIGYPPSVWVGDAPASDVKTKEIADVPWSAENLPVPVSANQQYAQLSVDDVVQIADEEGVKPGYNIMIPQTHDGVFTLSAFPPNARDEVTMHIDQYTGAVLADYRYDNYQLLGKIIAYGITIHKGTEFGIWNQIIGVIVCLGIVGIAVSGFILWLSRKPKGKLGSPKAPSDKVMKGVIAIIIILGIVFPLVGISIIIVWLFDRFVIPRVPALKRFFNA
ncbi:Uncharacterized iron-regulated membrane protein [Terribacillus aidingensis]|uniref:Uncharacterized iron-regulated membrane protein n=1 Tax=Terribacillus aidingensis TaxID=586416 RepID=A0A285MYY7_9BACI|nr:PepSY domain-containing protein [Terribacillus aidingensis]SNZ02430.1 Uncharacterized iron-regulated membrane protein [Terribacillus aidingensis]